MLCRISHVTPIDFLGRRAATCDTLPAFAKGAGRYS